MRILSTLAAAAIVATAAYAADVPRSYRDAQTDWAAHKDSPAYQTYAAEFVQFNNHFHIDERGGCYALGQGHVELMLVITHMNGAKFAQVQNVLSDVASAKASCFIKSYLGLPTKVPPYTPFVLQMAFS